MSDRPPDSQRRVVCRLRCFLCRSEHEHALRSEKPLAGELAAIACPGCGRTGSLQLARPLPPPPPEKSGRFDEPPDLEGDEYLIARQRGYHIP